MVTMAAQRTSTRLPVTVGFANTPQQELLLASLRMKPFGLA